MKQKNLIVTIKSWNIENARELQERDYKDEWYIMTTPKEFTTKAVNKINPRYIFFPHWSWIIPEEIWKNYESVVFHETDLPFGRGGSPIQNLIARGIYQTKISALRVKADIDAGDIYLKRPLDILEGNVEEILKSASAIIFNDMIPYIVSNNPAPVPQTGTITSFARRTPEEGDLSKLNNPNSRTIYDYIRMLDGEGYPRAYVPFGNGRFEFYDAHLKGDNVETRSRFRR